MFPRRTLLRHHLQYNHYPPIPVTEDHLTIAERAIDAEDPDTTCVGWNLYVGDGMDVMAREVLDAWHLWDFVEREG